MAKLANMDSYLARFINLCYCLLGGSILGFQTKTLMVTLVYLCRGVAQAGSASALGAEGREFESLHPDHFLGLKRHQFKQLVLSKIFLKFLPVSKVLLIFLGVFSVAHHSTSKKQGKRQAECGE